MRTLAVLTFFTTRPWAASATRITTWAIRAGKNQTWSQGARTGESQAAARANQRSEIRARRRGWGEDDEDEEKEAEEEDKAEGDEDRNAAPHGPRCMDPAGPATQKSCSALTE
jgi:hypothetical protein